MRIIMLIPVPCNLRRIVASVTYRNKMRTKIAQQYEYNETNLLSSSTSNVTCRIYCTESDSKPHVSLPMLVTNVEPFKTSFLMPFRLLFFSFKIAQIDKEFSISETDRGIIYAITVISNALANENYDSLEGLVAEDMIEILRTKIETLSSEQRSLIAINKESIVFQFLSDISTKTDKDHSVQIKMILHYIPGMAERKNRKSAFTFADMSKFTNILVCNYTFTRNYVNNIGGSWIATFVNHYSINVLL
ncbi:MAIP1 protein, partial [Acromyrmex insinuator]